MSEFEHGKLTAWGYVADYETLPDFITAQEFSKFTNGKFGYDERIAANIPSATASIRNYCGWHVSPSLDCGLYLSIKDLHYAFVGGDLLIQLPATYVSEVSKVVLNAVWNNNEDDWDGDVLDGNAYDMGMGNGLVRIYDVGYLDRRSKVFIKYKAGLPGSEISAIKELTAHRVTHAVSSSYGINSETAGGVSVSYNSSWAGNTRSTALPDDNKDVLEPYKVRGVF